MKFEWDPEKNRKNKIKHGIDFESATAIWDDPFLIVTFDEHIDREDRWLAIGTLYSEVLVVAVHTYRALDDVEAIRIISARKATKSERTRYEQT